MSRVATLRGLRHVAFAGALAVALLGIVAGAAMAGYSGTVKAPHAHATWSWNTNTEHLSGTLYDDSASDGKCAKVYDQGYNYFLGWGSWKLLATQCGGGHRSYSDGIYVYSDHVNLKVCAGNSTSGSECKAISAW